MLNFQCTTTLGMIGAMKFPLDVVVLGEFFIESGCEVSSAVGRYDFWSRERREDLVSKNSDGINCAMLSGWDNDEEAAECVEDGEAISIAGTGCGHIDEVD